MTMFNMNGDDSIPLRAALYARVSTDDQRERQTIDNQVHALREFAPHWNMTITDDYLDDGISGTIPMNKRPEGARLQEDAKSNKFDVVIFYRLDRLARSLRNFLDIVDFFEAEEIGLRSMTETFDTTNPMGRFAIQMIAAVAELERGTIIERTRMGRERKASEGIWTGGVVPYGYVVGEDRHLTPDWTPRRSCGYSEAEIVQRIFRTLVTEKGSAHAIAASLNLEGIPIYRKYHPKGQVEATYKERSGRMWRTNDVCRIVRSETYKGTHIWGAKGRQIIREVTSLVDVDIWQQAQQRLEANKRLPKSGKNSVYLLRGLVKCQKCGKMYAGVRMANEKIDWQKFYYRCGSQTGARQPGEPPCTAKLIGVEWLDNLVWNDIRSFIMNPGDVVQKLRERIESEAGAVPDNETRRRELHRAIAAKGNEDDRLLDAYRRGLVDIDGLEAQVRRSKQELEPLQAELAGLAENSAQKGQVIGKLTDAESLLTELQGKIQDTLDIETKRQVVEALVWGIEVSTEDKDGKKGGGKNATVEITYAFEPQVHAVESGTSGDERRAP